MKEVEKFIQDYTRNCSNEIGYCHNKTRNHNHVFYPWLTPEEARKAVEIAREETIKDMCEWNEEDEMIALSIKQIVNCASFLNIVPEKLDKIDKWLESLKQRMKR